MQDLDDNYQHSYQLAETVKANDKPAVTSILNGIYNVINVANNTGESFTASYDTTNQIGGYSPKEQNRILTRVLRFLEDKGFSAWRYDTDYCIPYETPPQPPFPPPSEPLPPSLIIYVKWKISAKIIQLGAFNYEDSEW